MDQNAVAGMIFTLLSIMLIGGFILLYPVTRHLGKLIEQKTKAGAGEVPDAPAEGEIVQLRELIRDLEAEVGRLSERQDFFEKLLAEPGRKQPERLPR
jgi:hypothetical protein